MRNQIEQEIGRSWDKLHEVLSKYDISIFAGAGLSKNSEMPDWAQLVAELSAHKSVERVWELYKRGVSLPSQLGIAEADFLRHESSRNGRAEWGELLRKVLYSEFWQSLSKHSIGDKQIRRMLKSKESADTLVSKYFHATNPALHEVVRMCSIRSDCESRNKSRIVSVLTTNLDSLLQICDRAVHGSPRALRTIERASKSTDSDKVPLYHLHGFLLPFPNTPAKKEAADRLILTEQEYISRTDQPNHWAATVLHWALGESPVVFIGCSMEDELCRRALYRTRAQRIEDAAAESSRRMAKHSQPKHFVVCSFRDNETNALVTKSLNLIDLNPLWVRNYEEELPDRLRDLRRELTL